MSDKTFTITVNVRELFTGFIPTLARQFLAGNGAPQGAGFTLTIDVSGSVYSYTVAEGGHFEVKEGPLNNPMVHLGIPLDSMARLADMKLIHLPIGLQGRMNGGGRNVLAGLQGTCVFQMKQEDGSVAEITATFNGAQAPRAVISLSMEDAAAVSRRKETPVQLFMNGRMVIDGDIALAMALQPLFA